MQNTLVITGNGVILMEVWTFLKMFLYLSMARKKAAADMHLSDAHVEGISNSTIYVSTASLLMFFMFLVVLFRVYIGRRAKAEGLGKRKRGGYLGLVFVMMIINAASVWGSLWQTVTGSYESGVITGIMATLMDILSTFVFFSLFRAARFVRKAEREGA
jgi:hypothetical protein